MKHISPLLRLLLALPLVLTFSCATSQGTMSEGSEHQARSVTIRHTWLSQEQLQLDFEPLPRQLPSEEMSKDEAEAVLAAFIQSFPTPSQFQVLPALASSTSPPAPWEQKLRAEFLKRYGASLLPLPDSIQRSPLFMALRLSPRYMGPGIRDAAQQMFRSPVFLASVTLSVLLYFSAWVLPEPLFSKAFAATLTARLALIVGLLELRNVALACLQLYRDAQAARTTQELEAVAERFGRALGGTALRVIVAVASLGIAKSLPDVPAGGLGALLGPPRYAMAGGLSFQSATTAHIVADSTMVIAGSVLGMAGSAVSSACTDGSEKKEGYQWHHIATDKNNIAEARGGPWTPLFRQIFAKAGMSLDDPANLVYLASHQGPHPEEYHAEVYDRLLDAIRDCKSVSHCRSKLTEALAELATKTCTPGSYLNRLLTQKSSP